MLQSLFLNLQVMAYNFLILLEAFNIQYQYRPTCVLVILSQSLMVNMRAPSLLEECLSLRSINEPGSRMAVLKHKETSSFCTLVFQAHSSHGRSVNIEDVNPGTTDKIHA